MRQFGKERDVMTVVVLCSALLCAGLFGCQDDTSPPGWGDFNSDAGDTGDTEITVRETFVPKERPSNSVCVNDWCWVHPRPVAHSVRELEPVADKLYGVVELDGARGLERLVWDDGIRILRNSLSEVSGELRDLTLAKDGWLALSDGGTLYLLGTEGIRDQFELPGREFTRVQGNSLSEFVLGTNDGGGLIRRGGDPVQDETLPANLKATKMWPNGEIWQMSTSAPVDPPKPDLRRWFPRPEPFSDDTSYLPRVVFGPSPASQCADRGPWTSVPFSQRAPLPFQWDSNAEEWKEPSPKPWGLMDFGCLSSTELLAANYNGYGYVYRGDRWERTFGLTLNGYRFSELAVSEGRIYIGGPRGSLATRFDGETDLITEGFQVPFAPESGLRIEDYADLWVADNGAHALLVETGNTHRLTSGDDSPFEWSGISTGRFTPAATSEVWGRQEPRFAISEHALHERIDGNWKTTELPDPQPESFDPVDLAGKREDGVWFGTKQDLYRYDGESWNRLSGPGSALRRTIDERDLTLTRLLFEESGDLHIAAKSKVFRLTKREGGWMLGDERTAPCNRVSAMHRGGDGSLWVAGDDTCVAEYDDQSWQVYEPTFQWGISTASVPPNPLTSWEFLQQPDSPRPLVVSRPGILRPTADGKLERSYTGNMVDAVYLDSFGITLVLHDDGILAKYH